MVHRDERALRALRSGGFGHTGCLVVFVFLALTSVAAGWVAQWLFGWRWWIAAIAVLFGWVVLLIVADRWSRRRGR